MGKMTTPVLMIEDDNSLAAMVGEYLGAFGITVTARPTASAGLELVRQGNFEALILDVMLPDLDGFDVCRRVRAESDLPILMLTARGDEMDRIVGLELGADDYLPKPFHPRELLARLRAILRRSRTVQTPRTASLRFGRLDIDRDARVVRIDGEERPLTGYQFNLLYALATHAGRVMSREALMDQVRGEELEAFDRSIDVHISRIRAAIEDNPKHPRRIITVRGAGYVFAKQQDDDQRV
jgi:DNA-binding response OmpR family regulator